ncbi:proline--tRNA ligase [Candidatus Woesearchaeota archaeon]|nr:proline--tRNA ligase [Candidatus Woesearchaeota archaeon]
MALKNKKQDNFSEWYTELVGETGAFLADTRYGIQGAIVETPWAIQIIRAFEQMLEKEVEADGHKPMLFPSIVPEKYIEKEKEHIKGFAPELFWVTKGGKKELKEKFFLRPTGESQIYPMYSIWVRSHNDLPLKQYQSRTTVFRFEPTTRPFLRGREFNFFEAHDVFKSEKEIMKQVKKDMKYTKNVVYKKLGLPFIFVKRPQWDKFAGAVNTYGAETLIPDGRVNTIASTHNLGQNFSKAFNIKFTDENEKEQFAWQTCYGPGIVRIMAGLISIHGDDSGLVLPFEVAPVQIVIIPIQKTEKKCEQLEKKLKALGYRVKYDNSKNTPGWKFNEWEMKGVPIRIEIGPKEIKKNKLVLVRRDTKKKETISEKVLEKKIKSNANALLKNIRRKAEKSLKAAIKTAKTLKDVKKILENKGIARANWCSMDKKGEKCADKLQTITSGGKVRGTLFDKKEKAKSKCVVCGKKANHVVYIAKSY